MPLPHRLVSQIRSHFGAHSSRDLEQTREAISRTSIQALPRIPLTEQPRRRRWRKNFSSREALAISPLGLSLLLT